MEKNSTDMRKDFFDFFYAGLKYKTDFSIHKDQQFFFTSFKGIDH